MGCMMRVRLFLFFLVVAWRSCVVDEGNEGEHVRRVTNAALVQVPRSNSTPTTQRRITGAFSSPSRLTADDSCERTDAVDERHATSRR